MLGLYIQMRTQFVWSRLPVGVQELLSVVGLGKVTRVKVFGAQTPRAGLLTQLQLSHVSLLFFVIIIGLGFGLKNKTKTF